MERTLIILKPDAVQRGLVGEITSRFEKAGLKIVGMKMLQPDYDHYYHHYENIGHWFSDSELHEYKTAHEHFTQPGK
jgi:nucleoside-diphosphate kinase